MPGCRKFLDLLSSLRLKSLDLTPSESLHLVIMESGYLEYYKARLGAL